MQSEKVEIVADVMEIPTVKFDPTDEDSYCEETKQT